MKLYELTEEMQELMALVEEESVDEETLLDTWEGVEGEFNQKIENYCKVIKSIEAQQKAIKEEVDRLNARKKTLENNIKGMKLVMYSAMKSAEKTSAGGDIFKVSIQKISGAAPLILDVPVENLPSCFQKVSVEANNEVLREAIKNGDCKYAHLGELGEGIRIR